MPDISLIGKIQTAVEQAQEHQSWVIIVCPENSPVLETFQTTASGVFPPGTIRSSRTAILPEGGKITVKDCTHPIPDTGFAVMFLGWEENVVSDMSSLKAWREKAWREIPQWVKN